ncbi:MAG: molecular chaperone DnaJ [Chloroflexi bacterium]|nr:molecular chaperone DnaJ [Chloroflexota bacterium]
MATKRDYYEILGLSRDSSKDDIKAAYRKLAKQYHPDVNKDDGAEEKFKEVSEAYSVLSDDEKRAAYNRFGHAAFQGAGAGSAEYGGFGDFADIFEQVFGTGFSGRSSGTRRGPRRGADLRYELAISFDEAVHGVQKEIEVSRAETCPTCSGNGAEPGTSPTRCATCRGSGEVRQVRQTFLGSMVNVTTCPTCRGAGEVITTPCHTCKGRGQVRNKRRLQVSIPAGVDVGTQIRLSGEGEPGTSGGPSGNLYVIINVEPHSFFRRRGDDVWLEYSVNIAQAVLGADAHVPTIDGEEKLKIPAGTQPGTVFPMRGRGVPHVQRNGRGDQFVVVNVAIPASLNSEQKKLFKELGKTLDGAGSSTNQKKSFFDNLSDFFGD